MKRGRRADPGGMRTRRMVFFALWALSLVAISFFGGTVSYGFFFGMSLVPVVSLVYILFVYIQFKIYQELGSRTMVCGEPVDYFFVLQNEDYFAFTGVSVRLFSDFSYVEELPGDVEYELLPGDRFTYETRLVCRYRGEYEVGVKEVVVTDFLRLVRVRYDNPGTVRAIVRPRVVRLTELNGLEEFQAILQRETASDTEPDILVREYAPGDALKQIHWKATARAGRLMTRTRTGEEKLGISVFCDMTRFYRKAEKYFPLENRILEVLLALGFFFAGKEMGFTAYYGQKGLVREQVQGMRDFDGFYQKVSEVVFQEQGDILSLLDEAAAQGGLWDSRILFLILHRVDAAVLEAAQRLAAQGRAVVIYAVTDRDIQDYVRQGTGRWKIVQVPIDEPLEGRL